MSQATEVELVVDAPQGCPVAAASDGGTVARSVSRSGEADDDTVIEEFTVEAAADESVPAEPIYETSAETRYRFERDADEDCFCALVEAFGCPVTDVQACDGTLRVTFYAPDVETTREIVGRLREHYDGVHLSHLGQPEGVDGQDVVRLDRGRLTDRQREVIETAFEMGYFERPKRANGAEVADELGISLSTFAEHVSVAQSKILDSVFQSPASA